ncbi:hypothetical protein [Aureimonas sp. N4]|uniref:hypothetical protein n=1 Tax=Aureimonas sp. N4 TaxID=1638165 RepID=UPI0012E34FD6|nr:hypothetical protein [Aureimonas sp. N4]
MSYRMVHVSPCLRMKVSRHFQGAEARIHVALDGRPNGNEMFTPAQSLNVERRHLPLLIAALQAVYDDTRTDKRPRRPVRENEDGTPKGDAW